MTNSKTDEAASARVLARPSWIRGRITRDEGFDEVRLLLRELGLNSVCVEAACPNRSECWKARHVTFLILGDVCTRNCSFCNITGGSPEDPDPSEPHNIAVAVKKLNARYVVITSVTRDDLADGGAEHFIRTVRAIKTAVPGAAVELLIPDLAAREDLLSDIAFSSAEVIAHNIEMPQELYPAVRPGADYDRSLNVIRALSGSKKRGANILVKSSIMLGLGETEEGVYRTLEDLRAAGTDIVYMGQYLSPSVKHRPVMKYYSPKEFEVFTKKAACMGFGAVCAGPMVRSSYRAREHYSACRKRSEGQTRSEES